MRGIIPICGRLLRILPHGGCPRDADYFDDPWSFAGGDCRQLSWTVGGGESAAAADSVCDRRGVVGGGISRRARPGNFFPAVHPAAAVSGWLADSQARILS